MEKVKKGQKFEFLGYNKVKNSELYVGGKKLEKVYLVLNEDREIEVQSWFYTSKSRVYCVIYIAEKEILVYNFSGGHGYNKRIAAFENAILKTGFDVSNLFVSDERDFGDVLSGFSSKKNLKVLVINA